MSSDAPLSAGTPRIGKVVIAGGFGAGKTTFVSSISDIEPLSTEATVSDLGGDLDGVATLPVPKITTTVALDFGRAVLSGDLWLYLFGTPGQERFHFMWDDLMVGALGAVVLVDTDRLQECFEAIDYFETRDLPFLVCVNCFDGVAKHRLAQVREALALPPDVPVLYTDARSRTATRQSLVTLVQHALERRSIASTANAS